MNSLNYYKRRNLVTTGQKHKPPEVLLQAATASLSLVFIVLPASTAAFTEKLLSHAAVLFGRFLPGSRFVISVKSIRAAIKGGATAGPSETHTLSPESNPKRINQSSVFTFQTTWIHFSSHPGLTAGDTICTSLLLQALVLHQIKIKICEDVPPRGVSDVGTTQGESTGHAERPAMSGSEDNCSAS